MKNIKQVLTPFFVLVVASCVTINVYFPAAAAQEVADEIVNEVLKQGPQQEQKKSKQEPEKPNTSFNQQDYNSTIIVKVLDFIIPVAQAGANMSIDSPKIRSLRNQLKQQHTRLISFFNKGNIGYADNGLLKVRNTNGLNIKQKSTMKKLLKTNNKILSSLYLEIAKANGHPEWKGDIQKTFAKTWIKQTKGGWMYFSAGKWKKK